MLEKIEVEVLSDRAIEYTIEMALTKLEQLVRETSGGQAELIGELKTLKSELANFVNMIGKGLGGEAVAEAAMDRQTRIKLIEGEIEKTDGLSKRSLPDRASLRKSASEVLSEFRQLLGSTDVAVARKAIAKILTSPDGQFMPIRVGSKETPERGKLVFEGTLCSGRMFSRFGTEGRTRTDKLLPAGDFESPVSTNSTTPAGSRAV